MGIPWLSQLVNSGPGTEEELRRLLCYYYWLKTQLRLSGGLEGCHSLGRGGSVVKMNINWGFLPCL